MAEHASCLPTMHHGLLEPARPAWPSVVCPSVWLHPAKQIPEALGTPSLSAFALHSPLHLPFSPLLPLPHSSRSPGCLAPEPVTRHLSSLLESVCEAASSVTLTGWCHVAGICVALFRARCMLGSYT